MEKGRVGGKREKPAIRKEIDQTGLMRAAEGASNTKKTGKRTQPHALGERLHRIATTQREGRRKN